MNAPSASPSPAARRAWMAGLARTPRAASNYNHCCVVLQHFVKTDTPTEHVDADQERSRGDAG